ncbi:hypothetical protein BDQ17DRAFT_1430497 [Cyathus striatus]|nr:hypothetical protein BDQ17DRAFT_1430497 [Cyathus striatus]
MGPKVLLSKFTLYITGLSSGLGIAVVKLVLSKGDIVIAVLPKPEVLSDLASTYSPSQLLVIKLDVSKPEEIVSAFDVAHENSVTLMPSTTMLDTGLSETIDKEVDLSWNIKVCCKLDIGALRMHGLDPSLLTTIQHHLTYGNTTSAICSLFMISESQISIGDSNKAMREIHRIASDKDAPLHISFGLDAIETMKRKIDLLKDNVENRN